MLRSVNDLKGYTIEATDGDVGEVIEFYFDDEKWTVRYLVAETGGWLMGRKVLISPVALGKVDWDSKRLRVNMPRERENSPDIDTDKPVSRQHEMAYCDYYNYPYYWGGPYLWGPVPSPAAYPGGYPAAGPSSVQKEIASALREQSDVHLRSTKEVTNYYIEASDGDIGHVEDFLIDDESWTIRYMVVDTRNWWPGKKVLVSPNWISSVSWTDSRVYVDLRRDEIKNSPEYDKQTLSRDYETQLYEHYRRPNYWSE